MLHSRDSCWWLSQHGAQLDGVTLTDATLRSADLTDANLSNANLRLAHLRGANLEDANLEGADLSEADLEGATGVTVEELEEQAASLEAATMPDGTEHDYLARERADTTLTPPGTQYGATRSKP